MGPVSLPTAHAGAPRERSDRGRDWCCPPRLIAHPGRSRSKSRRGSRTRPPAPIRTGVVPPRQPEQPGEIGEAFRRPALLGAMGRSPGHDQREGAGGRQVIDIVAQPVEGGRRHLCDARDTELFGPNRHRVHGIPLRIAVRMRAAGGDPGPFGAAAARQHPVVEAGAARGLEVVDAGEFSVDQAPAQPEPGTGIGQEARALVRPDLVEPAAARAPLGEGRGRQQRDSSLRVMTTDRRETPGGEHPIAEPAMLDNQNSLFARHAGVPFASRGVVGSAGGAVTTCRASARRRGRLPRAPPPSVCRHRFPRASRTAPWS